MDHVSHCAVSSAAVAAMLVLAGSAGLVTGLVGFAVARWSALAGIVLVAAVWYALPQVFGTTVAPETLAHVGSRYPFHLQASALLIALTVVAGIGAWRNGVGRSPAG